MDRENRHGLPILFDRFFSVENKSVSKFIGAADASRVDAGHVASASKRGQAREVKCANLLIQIKVLSGR